MSEILIGLSACLLGEQVRYASGARDTAGGSGEHPREDQRSACARARAPRSAQPIWRARSPQHRPPEIIARPGECLRDKHAFPMRPAGAWLTRDTAAQWTQARLDGCRARGELRHRETGSGVGAFVGRGRIGG